MISFVVTDVLTPEISKGDFDDFSGRIENPAISSLNEDFTLFLGGLQY